MGKSFSQGLLFCIFVTNTIYVLGIEIIELVVLARYSKKKTGHNFCDIILPYHNYERIKIVARYHKTMTAPPTP
jgi:hypothetical protein